MTRLLKAIFPKLGVACLLVASLAAGAVAPAAADNGPTATVDPADQEVNPGDAFSVDLLLDSNGTALAGADLRVEAPAEITITGIDNPELFGADALYIPQPDQGRLSAALVGDTMAVEGVFVTVNMELDAGADPGVYDVDVVAEAQDADGAVAVTEEGGQITVPGEVPPAGPSVTVMPETATAAAGGTFSVDVNVDSAGTPVSAVEVTLMFDGDLTATAVAAPDSLLGVDALYIDTIDPGEASLAGVVVDGPLAVDGAFATFDFNVDPAATGVYDLEVEATLLDGTGDEIAGVTENGGELVVGEADAEVSVDPATQNVDAPGTFTVDVLVNSAGIPVSAVEVTLTFDGDDLTLTDVAETDSLLGPDALYVADVDDARLAGATGTPIAVNGAFATYTFDVDAAATDTYDIEVDATLLDADMNPIAHAEDDGQATIGEPPEPGEGFVARDDRVVVGNIPEGATNVQIQLTADNDLDLELYDGGTKALGWNGAISEPTAGTYTYNGDTFDYSGYYGSTESISAAGPLSRGYEVQVFGYRTGGTYTVEVTFD